MKESGNRPPMMIPSKGLYMNHDLIRNARYHQVPLKLMEVYKKIYHVMILFQHQENW